MTDLGIIYVQFMFERLLAIILKLYDWLKNIIKTLLSEKPTWAKPKLAPASAVQNKLYSKVRCDKKQPKLKLK